MSKTMNGGPGSEIMSFSTASKMMANGGDVVEVPLMPLPPPRPISDGSWELRLLVTDLQVERVLRVKSDLHVGGLMIKLVDELGKITCSTSTYISKYIAFCLFVIRTSSASFQ